MVLPANLPPLSIGPAMSSTGPNMTGETSINVGGINDKAGIKAEWLMLGGAGLLLFGLVVGKRKRKK